MERLISITVDRELNSGKVIILIGQRQIGKTYELKRILAGHPGARYFDCEDERIAGLFQEASVAAISAILGPTPSLLLLLDEIQRISKIGSILKLFHDHFPKVNVVASGSASFLLLRNIGDSLYGRKRILRMLPLTLREYLAGIQGTPLTENFHLGGFDDVVAGLQLGAHIDSLLRWGTLPEVVLASEPQAKENLLEEYVSSLLFKDIFEIEGVRNPIAFHHLTKLLALQIGSEINPNELAQQLAISRTTVLGYIDLLEKFELVYRVNAFNTRPRQEIKKGFKIYFVDLGVRNALIKNFLPMSDRNDVGGLFENLTANTTRGHILYFNAPYQMFFWRSLSGSEVDLVLQEDGTGKLVPMEIKYRKEVRPAKAFMSQYADQIGGEFSVTKENLWKFM